MGGSVGKALGSVANVGVRIATDTVTGGLGEVVGGGISKKLGNMTGNLISNGNLGGSGGGNLSAPTIQGKQDPLSMLTMSGGAPLLTNIALGADPKTALMGYFGASGNYDTWLNNLDASDQQAIKGLNDQLTQIQGNMDMRNQAVKQLTTDFPNIMASSIPKYSAMADDATKQLMSQALSDISAKQAAGGAFSSGATAEAAANAGAKLAMDKLNYGTSLAYQDFSNQLSQATGLQAFQQKMLGQGATQGFNAVQNALQRNAGIDTNQANLNFEADKANQSSSNAMFGALGQLGGTAIGSLLGGPAGGAIGGQLGSSLASGNSGFMSSPRLNLPTDTRNA